MRSERNVRKTKKNQFYIQRWMNEHEIDEGPLWRREIVEERDPLGLFTDQPQVEKVIELRDDFGLSPLFYYCFVATKEQLARLFEIIPVACWTPPVEYKHCILLNECIDKSPLHYVALGGNLDTIQYMISWLNEQTDLSRKVNSHISSIGNAESIYLVLLFCLAFSGHFLVVQWLFSNQFPNDIRKILSPIVTQDLVTTIFLNADVALAQWALSTHFPDPFKSYLKTPQVFANAVSSGNVSLIKWIFSSDLPRKYRVLFADYRDEKHPHCHRFVSIKLSSFGKKTSFRFSVKKILEQADFQTMQWLLGNESPKKIKNHLIENDRLNIFALNERLFKNSTKDLTDDFRNMILSRDLDGNTFLHEIAGTIFYRPIQTFLGNRHTLQDFIIYQPELAASMWDVANKNGDTIDLSVVAFSKQQNSRISAIQLLKQILQTTLIRSVNSYPQMTDNDVRLLRAFKEKVMRFIKDTTFMDTAIVMYHFNAGLFQALYGKLKDQNLKIMFGFLQYENRTKLDAALLRELAADLSEKKNVTSKCGLFYRCKINPFAILIGNLKKIVSALEFSQMSQNDELLNDNIKKSAVVLKLILNDQRFEASLSEEDRFLLIALRNVLLRTEEIKVLIPMVVITEGDIILDEQFPELLNHIETEMKLVVSSEYMDSALMVLNGIRYLSTHFDELNAFAKAYPNKLFYLDTPSDNRDKHQYGKLPFHIDEYANDDILRNILSSTVREYIAAFNLARAAGKSKEFFEKTTSGVCLDGRIRDTATWVVQFSGVEMLDVLMERYVAEYVAYQTLINKLSIESISRIEPAVEFIMEYHGTELYQYQRTLFDRGNPLLDENGLPQKETIVDTLSKVVIEDYLINVLFFESDGHIKKGCCVLM